MLTRKQYELLSFIDRYLKATGFSPSFEEMKEALNLHSKSGIHRLVSALEERGFLRRHHHRARALEILRLPKIETDSTEEESKSVKNSLPKKTTNNQKDLSSTTTNQKSLIARLPLYGEKKPHHSFPSSLIDSNNQIEIPISFLHTGKYYALLITDDSMKNIGIFDGDIAIIQQANHAKNGSIVVVLIDQKEIILRRIQILKKTILLKPENNSYKTQTFPANRITIHGQLVTIIRHYAAN